jgi:CHAT domain-containing protein
VPSGVTIHVKHSIAVQPPVRGTAEDYVVVDNLEGGDLIELEFRNGVRQWISVDQFREDLRGISAQRGETSGVLTVPLSFNASGVARGGPEGTLKHLTAEAVDFAEDFFLERAAEPVAKMAARELVRRVERTLKADPGVYALPDPTRFGQRISPESLPGPEPILLFIHGTASSTQGSFGELTGTAEWERMRTHFNDRIVALEHNTLSVSPVTNAIEAAKGLPDGAVLNLVSHSRGGLVGELLCVGDISERQLSEFGRDRQADRAELEDLIQILRAKKFTIQRFVRVACPSRGTLLASKRLDLYLSVLLNLLGLLPILQANVFYKYMEALLKKLIALRADPNEIPGLEAQMPESPLIHLLNRPDLQTKADLAIIAGDAHGGGIFQALGTFALDVFYRKKHDFVVNTDAMYGGIDRGAGGYYFDDRGAGVSHFHYFKNPKTREQINAWLQAKTSRDAPEFLKLAWRERNLIFPGLRGGESLPKLIFVPGLFGTHLEVSANIIWLDWKNLLPGWLDELAMDRNVSVGEAIARDEELFRILNTSFECVAFAYDWRKSIADSAGRLANKLKDLLGQSSCPVHFLTVSSGCMVLQSMIAGHPELWQQNRERKGRAVILGATTAAARSAQLMIEGKHELVRLAGMLDRRSPVELGRLLESLTGIREAAGWATKPPPGGVYHICGRLGPQDPVPEAASFVDIDPRSLTQFTSLGDIVREVLSTGASDRLLASPVRSTAIRADTPVLYPTEQDLADAALETEPIAASEAIRISTYVTHGHLRDASYPVVVGHYLGDGIVSAEKILDQQLGGKLSENFHLDLYPGAEGTVEVIEAPDRNPRGALIIGLGEIGGIKAEKVRRGITAAALRYALSRVRQSQPLEGPLSLGITSLLLGTYGGSALTVRESMEAVLEGVVQANLALRSQQLWTRVRLENLEFIELYEDLAIQAAHELLDLEARRRRDADFAVQIVARRDLNVTEGGLFHRPTNPYQSGWWRRVSVGEVKGGLEFTILTDRARAEIAIEPTQRKLLTQCVDEAVSSSQYEEDLARVLFDLLLPPGLKDQIRDRTNLVFVLDGDTAYYPWEMLALHDGQKIEPVASRLGLIRQLRTAQTPKLRTSRRNLAAVIAIPAVPGDKWPALPHVREEAESVKQLLEAAQYKVTTVTGDSSTPRAILAAVLAENRILHLAGHGYFDAKQQAQSGFVIGDDLYLTAAEIGKIEPIPELVFLNCCYGGKIPRDTHGAGSPHRTAATLAEALINMGVKAVVASGWAVGDAAAREFATRFYDAMLSGAKFGEAVLRARAAVFRAFPENNTWGAYQCYGNPDFTLERSSESLPAVAAQPPRFVGRREVLESVKSIRSGAVDVNDRTRTALLQELSVIDRLISEKFEQYNDGEVLAEIAHAYAALGEFTAAEDAYQKAFSSHDSRVSVEAVEQFANLLYRKAERTGDAGWFEKARKYIDWTLELGRTVERLSLMGSVYKREARFFRNKSLDESVESTLETAVKYYTEACNPEHPIADLLQELNSADLEFDPYPAVNVLAIKFLLGGLTKSGLKSIDRVAERAAHTAHQKGGFWKKAAVVDAALIRQLVQSGITERAVQQDLAGRYREVFSFGSRRQRGSTISQIEFLRDMSIGMKGSEIANGLSALLAALEDSAEFAQDGQKRDVQD